MYERDACFVPQEGKIVKGTKNIRETVKSIINMNCKIESKVNRVIQTSNIAPVDTEWSFNCIRPDGKLVTITRKAPDLLRK
jgi:ketosteroid isomerase-like protein